MVKRHRVFGHLVLACAVAPFAQAADGGYRQPPEPLLATMRAPLAPALRLDPTGTTLLELQRTQYPPIARVAEPYIKLAGVRVEPRTHARHDMSSGYGIRTCLDGFALLDMASGKETPIALPAACAKSTMDDQPSACSSVHRPGHAGVIRPSGETQVISV